MIYREQRACEQFEYPAGTSALQEVVMKGGISETGRRIYTVTLRPPKDWELLSRRFQQQRSVFGSTSIDALLYLSEIGDGRQNSKILCIGIKHPKNSSRSGIIIVAQIVRPAALISGDPVLESWEIVLAEDLEEVQSGLNFSYGSKVGQAVEIPVNVDGISDRIVLRLSDDSSAISVEHFPDHKFYVPMKAEPLENGRL